MGDGWVHGSHHSRPSGLRHPGRQRCRHWPILWPQYRSTARGVPRPEKPGHRRRQTTLYRFHQNLRRYRLPCPLPLRFQQSTGRGPLCGKSGLEGDMRSLPQFRYHEMPPDEPRWSHLIMTHLDFFGDSTIFPPLPTSGTTSTCPPRADRPDEARSLGRPDPIPDRRLPFSLENGSQNRWYSRLI